MSVIIIKELEFHQLRNLSQVLYSAGQEEWDSIDFLRLECKITKEAVNIIGKYERALSQMNSNQNQKEAERLSKKLYKSKKGKLSLSLAEAQLLQRALLRISTSSIINAGLVQAHEDLAFALVNVSPVNSIV